MNPCRAGVLCGGCCFADGWLALSRVGEVVALGNVEAIGCGSMLWCWFAVRLGGEGSCLEAGEGCLRVSLVEEDVALGSVGAIGGGSWLWCWFAVRLRVEGC